MLLTFSDRIWVIGRGFPDLDRVGNWLPDFTQIDTRQDIWALQRRNNASGIQGLMVRPSIEEQSNWYHIRQFHILYGTTNNSFEMKAMSEMATIDLY
jgi:hypothetical protein